MFTIYGSIAVALAVIGWILNQLVIKKKKFREISRDVLAILFFIGVWAVIYYWLFY